MKKLLLTLLCAPLLMTGCLSDGNYEPPTMPQFTFNQLQFKGKLTATPPIGSEFAEFELDDVEFSILAPANPETDNKVTLSLKKVRFVEQMTKLIDCEYRNLVLMALPQANLLMAQAADNTIPMYPYYMGQPLDINQDGEPDPEFKTTKLLVQIAYSGDKITKGRVTFHCNTMDVQITGDPINPTASTTPTTPTTPAN